MSFLDAWHSWDSHPWRHPWLTPENLSAMRDFSRLQRAEAAKAARRAGFGWRRFQRMKSRHIAGYRFKFLGQLANFLKYRKSKFFFFAFVGNIANNMYARACALKTIGVEVDLYGHPQDRHVMSYPDWEELDQPLAAFVSDINELRVLVGTSVEGFRVLPQEKTPKPHQLPRWVRKSQYEKWPGFFAQLPTLRALRQYNCLMTVQTPYLAYLSGRPYYACHYGGDLWYECARDDAYGHLQRASFENAAAILVSNPWVYAAARRYGFKNAINLPLMLDQDRYSPGPAEFRPTWQEKIGGDFFVMQTARLDEFYKKSSVAIEGFAKFARKCPGARLIVLSWGKDEKAGRERLSELGVEEQCLFIPASGKRRLIRYLRSADCLLDQFRLGYYGATGLEALACGVPVIMRIEQSQYEAQNETGAPPVLQSETADEVAAHLERLYTDRRHRRAVGKASRQWFLANHGSKKWAPVYRDMLIALASGHRFDFSQSPLQQPQSKAETDYLARELKKAPVFPNYQ